MRRLLIISLVVIIAVALILVGCGTSKTTQPTTKPAAATTAATTATATKYGGILTTVPHNAPTTPLGYPAESDSNSADIAAPVIEGLLKVRDTVVPALATSWTIADDGKSITMNLRKGIKFHDGSEFNATVAKWNLDIMIEAKKVPYLTSVDIIDNNTIRLNLKNWDNTIIDNLERDSHMISKSSFEKNGVEWARWHPVGTGPFKFVEYQRDVKIVYERNDSYWQEGKPYLDGIEYYIIPDETVQKISFQNGKIYCLRAAGTTAQELVKAGYPYQKIAGGTFTLFPDSANPSSPFADKNVRLAASHAIDRESIAKGLGYGLANPAYQLYPGFKTSAIPGLDIHKYNPDKARQLLAAAGYTKGFATSVHKFIVVPEDQHIAVANMLVQVGINAKPLNPEPGLYSKMLGEGWDGMLDQALPATSNNNQWFKIFLSGQIIPLPSLKKPDGLLNAINTSCATKSLDPQKIQAVIKLLHDDALVIPFIEEVAIVFFQKGVHDTGMLDFSLDTWIPENAWIEANLR